ncbi:MAG: diacylglycerol kinase [Magnetococcales bacterium]|nr:diacylglycerol kinase [Magnetococcales bacterium]
MKPGATGLTRVINAAGYSMLGLRAAWHNEAAFRQELGLLVIGLPLGLWLGNTGVERALLTGSLLVVLIVELINSAVEAVVDRIGAELHPLSGRAKDIGSAAVLLALLLVGLVWGCILWERLT